VDVDEVNHVEKNADPMRPTTTYPRQMKNHSLPRTLKKEMMNLSTLKERARMTKTRNRASRKRQR
jgi:hypothetical protein